MASPSAGAALCPTMHHRSGELELESHRDDVLLYHLRVLQLLSVAHKAKDVRSCAQQARPGGEKSEQVAARCITE